MFFRFFSFLGKIVGHIKESEDVSSEAWTLLFFSLVEIRFQRPEEVCSKRDEAAGCLDQRSFRLKQTMMSYDVVQSAGQHTCPD